MTLAKVIDEPNELAYRAKFTDFWHPASYNSNTRFGSPSGDSLASSWKRDATQFLGRSVEIKAFSIIGKSCRSICIIRQHEIGSKRLLSPYMRYPNTTVPIEFVRQLLNVQPTTHRQDLDNLAKAGIAVELLASDQARVTAAQFAEFYRQVVATSANECPGMFSRPLKPGSLKFLCCGVVTAPDLLVALKSFCQFFTLVLDDLQFKLQVNQDWVSVVLVPEPSKQPPHRFAQEVMVKLVHGVLSWLAAKKMPIARLDLAYPPPAYASDYVFLFPGPAYFDQPVTAIHFERRLISAPVRQRWESIREFLVRAPADWMFVSFADRLASHRVREFLGSRITESWRIEEVADALLLSARTLARRLAEEGTSFQQIKDEVRRDSAVELLTRSTLTPAQVAERIGFNDTPTFYRAFKRWTGCSPGAYTRGTRS